MDGGGVVVIHRRVPLLRDRHVPPVIERQRQLALGRRTHCAERAVFHPELTVVAQEHDPVVGREGEPPGALAREPRLVLEFAGRAQMVTDRVVGRTHLRPGTRTRRPSPSAYTALTYRRLTEWPS